MNRKEILREVVRGNQFATTELKKAGSEYEVGQIYTLPPGTVISNSMCGRVTLAQELRAKCTLIEYDYVLFSPVGEDGNYDADCQTMVEGSAQPVEVTAFSISKDIV